MFSPKYIKEGKLLLKGVKKFVNYKRDVLPPEKLAEIEASCQSFRAALKERDKPLVEARAVELQRLCERASPIPSLPGFRENVEVFFVAIVIALGIRTYFLQPFKIPTGSMQPTLNGVLAFDTSQGEYADFAHPGFIGQAWDLIAHGRNYIEKEAETDFRFVGAHQKDFLKFFSFTYLEIEEASGKKDTIRIWAPMKQVFDDFGLGARLGMNSNPVDDRSGPSPILRSNNFSRPNFQKGETIVRGFIDTGDQVLVNKFSYHFRKPERGEVFVFTTKNIDRIDTFNNVSQHYIKRLAGLPGDSVEIREPALIVNGEVAKEPGFERVMSLKDGYNGYVDHASQNYTGWPTPLGEKEYIALGDNSRQSFDSRGWGTVPEENLVGPALFVYWPFAKHWGTIH